MIDHVTAVVLMFKTGSMMVVVVVMVALVIESLATNLHACIQRHREVLYCMMPLVANFHVHMLAPLMLRPVALVNPKETRSSRAAAATPSSNSNSNVYAVVDGSTYCLPTVIQRLSPEEPPALFVDVMMCCVI
jgi:hypothetical protein